MEKIVIDCCEMPLAQQGDSRVCFVHTTTSSSGFSIQTVRNHVPLSVAMQLISFNQAFPNGMSDEYLISPEKVDTVGHVEA